MIHVEIECPCVTYGKVAAVALDGRFVSAVGTCKVCRGTGKIGSAVRLRKMCEYPWPKPTVVDGYYIDADFEEKGASCETSESRAGIQHR